MKYLLACAFFIMILSGCKKADKADPPARQIPPAIMANILIDIHVQQSVVAIRNLPPDSARRLSAALQRKILEKHGVDDSTFRKNYNYYVQTGEMEQIYEVVIDSLGVRESESIRKKKNLPPPSSRNSGAAGK